MSIVTECICFLGINLGENPEICVAENQRREKFVTHPSGFPEAGFLRHLCKVGRGHCFVQSPDRPEDADRNDGISVCPYPARHREANQNAGRGGFAPKSAASANPAHSSALLPRAGTVGLVFVGSRLRSHRRIQSGEGFRMSSAMHLSVL